MARRKRLTKTKKSKTIGGDPDAPTEAEWESMEPFGLFAVSDQDDIEHLFKVGDTAIILPEHKSVDGDVELWEYWVGKIKEIRASGPTPDVWVRVQWYWSPTEVANVIKSFDDTACGERERLLSDHYDFVSTSCFSGIATIKKYREDNLEPNDIGATDFYMRYTLEHKARRVDPKPAGTCVCKRPYNPDDADVMHLCPRPSCRTPYHRSCLLAAGAQDTDTSDRGLRLLTCSPDTDRSFSLSDLAPEPPPGKQRRNEAKGDEPGDGAELLDSLPMDLVRVAQQPIVKGAKAGVVGNVRGVVRARRMVYQAIRDNSPAPEDWDQSIDAPRTLALVYGKRVPALLCLRCKSPI